MKIGIVNFHPSYNYGGTLQYYAMQMVLSQLGHEVQLINRRWGDYSLPRPNFVQMMTKRFFPFIDAFETFRKTHCRIGYPIRSDRELREYAKSLDAVLAGSDQIWNAGCMKVMGGYYLLDWVPYGVRHLSYSASFGCDSYEVSDEELEMTKSLLCRFEDVSVREYAGVDLCSSLFDIQAQYHIDPTFLLSIQDYEQLFLSCTEKKGDFILSYFLDKTEEKAYLAHKLSLQIGIGVIDNNPLCNRCKLILNPKKYKQPSVEQWVRNIYDAQIVVTDSFHGMVFSLLFNRPFLCIGNEHRGLARFDSLCRTFDLGNIILSESSLGSLLSNEEIIIPKVNYTAVNRLLEVQRTRSMNYFNRWC